MYGCCKECDEEKAKNNQRIAELEAALAERAQERDALAAMTQRLYPYMERVSHVHLPDGTLLQASDVWDAMNKPAECLATRLAAERKAGAVGALNKMDDAVQWEAAQQSGSAEWALTITHDFTRKLREQIERGEVKV